MYFLVPFIVENFPKILRADSKLRGRTIFRPTMVRLPKKGISSENTLVNLVAMIHVYLHAKYQGQMPIHY